MVLHGIGQQPVGMAGDEHLGAQQQGGQGQVTGLDAQHAVTHYGLQRALH